MAGVLAPARKLSADLLEFFFPPACPICNAPPAGDKPICARCEAALTLLPDPVCARCRAFVPNPHDRCVRGHRRQPKMIWAPGLFDDYYRELIHAFKFDRRTDCGAYLGARMGAQLADDPRAAGIDLVIPVPLHRTRERERGFNQSVLLSEAVAAALERPVTARALRRIRHTPTQTALDYRQRRENVAGAFVPGTDSVERHVVLLVDDVMTTGATLAECAGVLKKAGAVTVYGAVAALAVVGN